MRIISLLSFRDRVRRKTRSLAFSRVALAGVRAARSEHAWTDERQDPREGQHEWSNAGEIPRGWA
jgi:hypothetical protein